MKVVSIEQTWTDARKYIGSFHSVMQFDRVHMNPSGMLDRVKRHNYRFSEAILLLHLAPNLSVERLGQAVNLRLTSPDMEVIAGFFIRHEMNDGKRNGNFILSTRQQVRRAKKESYAYDESLNSPEIFDRLYKN